MAMGLCPWRSFARNRRATGRIGGAIRPSLSATEIAWTGFELRLAQDLTVERGALAPVSGLVKRVITARCKAAPASGPIACRSGPTGNPGGAVRVQRGIV